MGQAGSNRPLSVRIIGSVIRSPGNRREAAIMFAMITSLPTHSRSLKLLIFPMIGLFLMAATVSASWPTYQHDHSRSGSTAQQPPKSPSERWVYRSPSRPIPAWDEPALWDGWSKVHDLKNRQPFDKAFHVAVSEGRVYFGSSIDDQIHCVEASSGQQLWSFFTEGPVRLAPTVVDGRLYVGSDDGFVYCLNAANGELIWKSRPGPNDRRVVGNGRVISPWAIRTGVVVVDDTVFCGAGVIPSEGVYVAALNTADGSERWKTQMSDLPAQGYMLASSTRLYVVTARDTPLVLDAKTGKRLFKVKGGTGGTYALLTGDTLLYGPNKTGDVSMVGQNQDVLASFRGNHMIVARPWSYLQNNDKLTLLDRATYVKLYAERGQVAKEIQSVTKQMQAAKKADKTSEADAFQVKLDKVKSRQKQITQELKDCLKWEATCDCPHALILTDGAVIAGGDGKVMAVNAETGKALWSRSVTGKAYGLAVSDGNLFVSTDEGSIHCFADIENGQSNSPVPSRITLQTYPGPRVTDAADGPVEFHGPFAEFISPTAARISWDSTEPMTTEITFGVETNGPATHRKTEPTRYHELVVDAIQPNVVYRFKIGGTTATGREIVSPEYRFDAFLNYLPVTTPDRPSPFPEDQVSDQYRSLVQQLLDRCGARRGHALVLGATNGRFAYELAKLSDLKITIIEPDSTRVNQIRKQLAAAGLYGSRVAVHQRNLDHLPYGPFLANLIVSERMVDDGNWPASFQTSYDVLRPAGGIFALYTNNSTPNTTPQTPGFETVSWEPSQLAGGQLWTHRRDKLPGTGEWTHQYGGTDNAACSQDDVVQGEMGVLWWGRPGARPMPDRGNRNPPPVSANGRLYIQGNRTLFGVDAYNGAILWAKQIPNMRRANMPRDGSNMVATDDHLYVAMGDRCVVFDGQSGDRLKDFSIPEPERDQDYHWGYVARQGNQLVGSSVQRGAHYLGDKGEWYDSGEQKDVARVTSANIFSIDTYTGDQQWVYNQGVVINSTITIADGRIYFIESRSADARDADSGRLVDELSKDQHLVALNASTGKLVWEIPYDFSKCRSVTYMTHGNGTLLVTGTDKKNIFHTYAFNSEDGKELWQHETKELKGHHTGHLAHPTIVGDLVYFNKHTYELRTGKVLGVHKFNWHGCGVMSASNHSVFSRYEYHGMLDLKTNERTEFLGIRSGCWLSLIPSGGLLLAPETSAGCSCGHSLQTSIAYVPTKLIQLEPKE